MFNDVNTCRKRSEDVRNLKVAICDDNEKDRLLLYNLCKLVKANEGIEIKVKQYETGDALLFDLHENKLLNTIDVMLLDINMPGKNGIEIAEELQNIGYQGAIIFFTNSNHHWRDAFDLRALNYITKNEKDVEKRFLKVFMSAYEEAINKKDRKLLFSSLGEMRQIALSTISHFEVADYLVKVYYDGETFEFISSLAKIEELLFGNIDFFRISRNCIVSIPHIRRIENNNVIMRTGQTLPISSRRVKTLKAALMENQLGFSL